MKWLAREREKVLTRWKANEIGYMAAVTELTRLGMSLEAACQLVAKT